jgi:preprotein translocase subunit SecE
MSWQVYRPGEGRWARILAMLAIVLMGLFSAYRWHLWAEKVSWRIWWLPGIGAHQMTWSEVGAAILMIVFMLVGYRICFARVGTSDFLIETEIELRKVTWPQWKPLFKSDTELWGSTYVVILVIAALAAFVGLVDLGLGFAHKVIFLR